MAQPAPGLVDRRVEITGPTDQKMTINALNSGAKVWLADFEDANTPLWDNMITGQLNLKDALDRTIDFTSPEGKAYELRPDEELATIVVRPRGWHLPEKHVLVDGERVSGSLFDFALYFTHCARRQLDKGKGPYFYLAKMESHQEARLWNDAFCLAQDALGIPRGSVRATVLIETIPAAFEMEEILYELRDHSAGLNAGRWDYLFSIIKKFRTRGRDFVLPERNSVTMTAPFMRAYTELLVSTCHGRGAHAMGGMAAFIPSRRDPEVNEVALAKVRDDKTRESNDGFDGSWVAHPDLVPICREVFDGVLGAAPNQLGKLREDVSVSPADLLAIRPDARHHHRGRAAQQRQRRPAVPGQLAGRNGGRRDLQPHGGRGHRGDLPVAGVAVAAQRHHPGRRAEGHPRVRRAGGRREELATIRGAVRRGLRRGRATTRRRRCSPRSRWPTTTPTSSPSRRTSGCRRRAAAAAGRALEATGTTAAATSGNTATSANDALKPMAPMARARTGGVAAASAFWPVFWMPRARPAHAEPAYSATAVNASPLVLTATRPQASSTATATGECAAAAPASASMAAPVLTARMRIGRIRLPARSDQ